MEGEKGPILEGEKGPILEGEKGPPIKKVVQRPKLKLGGLLKAATPANINEYGTGDQTGDLTSMIAVERKPIQEVADVPQSTLLPKVPRATKGTKAIKDPLVPKAQVAPEDAEAAEADALAQEEGQKYGEKLEKYAEDILEEDIENPYKDKSDAPIFPIQSRLGFQKQIFRVFSSFHKIPEFGKPPDFDACKKLSADSQQQLEVYEYQKFVREYMRGAAPYRGILVYHGLGSGKTCSAIAAAEALFSVSKKKIIVMTPSSLRDNFIREVTFCGFRHFRLKNHWVKLEKDRLTTLFASEVLGLPESFLKKASVIWVPDYDLPPNTLTTDERQQITKQLVAQINSRIEFINYNGISATRLKEIACAPVDEEGNGHFDNKVIIIDEIHNVTRLMQGTIEPYLTSIPGLKRKVPLEPVTPSRWEPALCKQVTDMKKKHTTNYKRGYLLYRLLEGAKGSKIIGLSGTPLINFPEEIAILVNLLGGYIHTASFTVTPANEKNRMALIKLFKSNPRVDFEEVELQGFNMSVLVTALPDGMVKAVDSAGVLGVQRSATPTKSLMDIIPELVREIEAGGLKVIKQPEFKSEPLLPPVGEEFRKLFLEVDGTTLKNTVVLRKRLQGLISYYRGSKKELMPTVTRDELIRVPFSPYMHSNYILIRTEELKQEREIKKKNPSTSASVDGGKMGNLIAELYDIAKMKTSTNYRMFSRQACNFAFPEGIVRPRSTDKNDLIEEIGVDKEILDTTPIEMTDEININDAEGALAADALAEGTDASALDVEEAEREDEEIEKQEEEDFKEGTDVQEALAQEEDLVMLPEIEAIPAAPLKGAVEGPKTLTAMNVFLQKRKKQEEECKVGFRAGREKFNVATKRAKTCLETFAKQRMRLYGMGKKIADELAAGTPPNADGLVKYSPKYAAILQKIIEGKGSSLVYSQFLDMEGIGIFLTVLKANDFNPIVIEESGRFSEDTIKSLKRGPSVNRFLSFTGKEKPAVRSLALKVFNAKFSESAFTELPKEMSDVLVEAGFTGNLRGELCRVFCITSAGAEGLSLKNVRRVHIMEPYWNPVRTDQVKGRAVRICSHIDLNYSSSPEENERTVEVYTYCSTFANEALLHPDGTTEYTRIDATNLSNDLVKASDAAKMGIPVITGVKDYFITSDEHLYALSESKKKLLQNIQNLMKTSAVDCQINQYENEEDGLGCITLPGNPEQYAYHPILSKDIAETSTRFKDAGASFTEVGEGIQGIQATQQGLEGTQQGLQGTQQVQQQLPQQRVQKKTVTAKVVKIDSVDYIAVPVMSLAGTPLSYDLYARGDLMRSRKIGRALADSDGTIILDESVQIF